MKEEKSQELGQQQLKRKPSEVSALDHELRNDTMKLAS
jgi:hypothetical protein